MDLTSQSIGNQRTALNLTKRRRSEDSIQSLPLLQLQVPQEASWLHRAYRWKLTKMTTSCDKNSGCIESSRRLSLLSPIEIIHRHDSTEESTPKEATPPESPPSQGLRKKARCSSLGSESLKDEIKLVEEEAPKLPRPSVDVDPDTYLIQLVQAQSGKTLKVKAALELENVFPDITDAQVAAYSTQVVAACRNNEVETLKSLWKAGHSMECCNRFGESLLHMACRRGFLEVVQFLLEEVGLAVCIRDDCGRTPLHDACWHAQPQLRICEMLLERDPRLLLIADKRGHTPFQYARDNDWPLWRTMLYDHREQLQCLAGEDTMKQFS